MNKNKLYKIGTSIGLLTMTVGLAIFLVWWGARAMFALNLSSFQDYGFFWILISIPLGIIALILNSIYLAKNYKTNLRKCIIGIAIVLINIPVVLLVVYKVGDIQKRVYVQIIYEGAENLSSLKLESDYFEKEVGKLKSQDSKVIYYYLELSGENPGGSPPGYKPIRLYMTTEVSNQKIELVLPNTYIGSCTKIYIDKEYKLLDRY